MALTRISYVLANMEVRGGVYVYCATNLMIPFFFRFLTLSSSTLGRQNTITTPDSSSFSSVSANGSSSNQIPPLAVGEAASPSPGPVWSASSLSGI